MTVNYLFRMTDTLSFNEYIEERADEMREAFLQERRQNHGLHEELSRKALEEYHPDPDGIRHPSTAHKAYAGLKELMLTASETFVHTPGVLDRLAVDYGEVVRNREARPEIAKTALRDLIRMVLLDQESDPTDNIYADDVIMNDNGEDILVNKQVVWDDVERWLYGDGVVGITEQMSDVRFRGELSVLVAVLDRVVGGEKSAD